MAVKILLTGAVGSGKSTVVDGVLRLLQVAYGGFRTTRCLVDNRRAGFTITDIMTGATALIAEFSADGELIAHPEGFETIGVRAIKRALAAEEIEIIVMDELGFLELGAPRFQAAVLQALHGPKPVLGVLKQRHNSFLDEIRMLHNVRIINVDKHNRDRLPAEIAPALRSSSVINGQSKPAHGRK